jgi:hypothetical protein
LVAEDFTGAGWDRGRVITVDGARLRLPAAANSRSPSQLDAKPAILGAVSRADINRGSLSR